MTLVPEATSAIRVHRAGGPDVLALESVAMPNPSAGQVRIRVHAAGVNYPDLLWRAGRLPSQRLPFTPGVDVTGVVDAVGPEVDGFFVGTRVVAALFPEGGYSEHIVVPIAHVTELPPAVTYEEGIALPISGLTALLALRLAGRISPGDSVFVPAAAGGVGSLAVQLAKLLGARCVIGGASSEEKRRAVMELGADLVVDYTRESWPGEVRAATNGIGADVILEAGGNKMVEESLRALAPGGRLVVFGAEDAMNPPTLSTAQTQTMLRQAQAFVGFALSRVPENVRRAALAELFELVAAKKIRVLVDRFSLADAPRAHAAMEARATKGKVILRPASMLGARDVLAKFNKAIQALSADELADLFSEDAVYEFPFLNPNRPARYDGREEIRAGFRAVWVPGRIRVDDVRFVAHETRDTDLVIAEEEVDAVVAATGRCFTSRAVLVLRVRNGRIVHLRDYADTLQIARATGRLPELVDSLGTLPAS